MKIAASRQFEAKIFKNGNSKAVYIPHRVKVQEGERYVFTVKTVAPKAPKKIS